MRLASACLEQGRRTGANRRRGGGGFAGDINFQDTPAVARGHSTAWCGGRHAGRARSRAAGCAGGAGGRAYAGRPSPCRRCLSPVANPRRGVHAVRRRRGPRPPRRRCVRRARANLARLERSGARAWRCAPGDLLRARIGLRVQHVRHRVDRARPDHERASRVRAGVDARPAGRLRMDELVLRVVSGGRSGRRAGTVPACRRCRAAVQRRAQQSWSGVRGGWQPGVRRLRVFGCRRRTRPVLQPGDCACRRGRSRGGRPGIRTGGGAEPRLGRCGRAGEAGAPS